jgi:hypothetical protein
VRANGPNASSRIRSTRMSRSVVCEIAPRRERRNDGYLLPLVSPPGLEAVRSPAVSSMSLKNDLRSAGPDSKQHVLQLRHNRVIDRARATKNGARRCPFPRCVQIRSVGTTQRRCGRY